MSDTRVDVYLLSEPQAGVTRSDLVRNLAGVFRKEKSAIEKMLNKPRFLVKQAVDESLGKKYRTVIEKAGGQCELVALPPVQEPVQESMHLAVAGAEPSVVNDSTDYDDTSASSAEPVSPPDEERRHCYKCGALMNYKYATNCPKCFAPQQHFTSKNKTLAGFLALFLGGLGVHRFYLGQWWGLFYMVFWFTLIPSVVSIIEAIVFWCTPDNRWQQKYGQVPKAGGVMAAIFCAAFFVFIMLLGIVSAIALPAYQDYTYRVKVASAMPLIEKTRKDLQTAIETTGSFPGSNLEAGLPESISNDLVSSILVKEDAAMQVTFNLQHSVHAGDTMVWTPSRQNGELVWSCKGGTLPDRFRMSACRGGSDARNNPTASDPGKSVLSKRMFSDDRRLSINVPANWREDKSLSEHASIGAANVGELGYLIVIAEPREDFDEDFELSQYTELVLSLMNEALQEPQTLSKLRRFNIKGLAAEQLVLTGQVENHKITYLITTVESDRGFYQVLSWTTASRFKEKHKQLRAISRTFEVRTEPAN